MNKSKYNLLKINQNDKGITLVILVVTVVVLIIIASIVINMSIKKTGTISGAENARNASITESKKSSNMQNDWFEQIEANKENTTSEVFSATLSVTATGTSNGNGTASITVNASGITDTATYTFYIKKVKQTDDAYIQMYKGSQATANFSVDDNANYIVKVVANCKDRVFTATSDIIALGDNIKISVQSASGQNSYPDILIIKAISESSPIKTIKVNGTNVKDNINNSEAKITYNATKNGPITISAIDAQGNQQTYNYAVTDVIDFITEWTVPENTTITVPVYGNIDAYIDYGDGNTSSVTANYPTHTYANAGTYTMKVSGKCDYWGFNSSTRDYLTKLKQWGCLENRSYTFGGSISGVSAGCINLKGNIPSPSTKSFEKIVSCYQMFSNCSNLDGNIPENLFANFDSVESIDFRHTFYQCNKLTGSIPSNLFANCNNTKIFERYIQWM